MIHSFIVQYSVVSISISSSLHLYDQCVIFVPISTFISQHSFIRRGSFGVHILDSIAYLILIHLILLVQSKSDTTMDLNSSTSTKSSRLVLSLSSLVSTPRAKRGSSASSSAFAEFDPPRCCCSFRSRMALYATRRLCSATAVRRRRSSALCSARRRSFPASACASSSAAARSASAICCRFSCRYFCTSSCVLSAATPSPVAAAFVASLGGGTCPASSSSGWSMR
mmetsp:Transcript_34618/g.101741  ORF Transcript_34618/g.101741 Transcript_34618/m.101741 type:complete len:225 (+) Transcript_34618:57-731(+)